MYCNNDCCNLSSGNGRGYYNLRVSYIAFCMGVVNISERQGDDGAFSPATFGEADVKTSLFELPIYARGFGQRRHPIMHAQDTYPSRIHRARSPTQQFEMKESEKNFDRVKDGEIKTES